MPRSRCLTAAGYTLHTPTAPSGRPVCCGRTYLATGMIDAARATARELLLTMSPFVARGVPIIGLEPSCVLGLRDELRSLLPGDESTAVAAAALTFEEFVVREHAAGRWSLSFKPSRYARALVHGHCHQKAFGVMPAVHAALELVPGLVVEPITSSCCGMAGAFGYEAEHVDVSLRMAEAGLLPAVRAADCRQPRSSRTARAAGIRSATVRNATRSTSHSSSPTHSERR